MEQEYIKGDIVMYDNRIHTIMVLFMPEGG